MKYILTALIATMAIISCQKEVVKPVENLPKDVILENKVKDREVAMRKHTPSKGKPSVIYLDFDGQVVNNSNWSSAPITCAPSGLTPSQQVDILQQVQAAYSAYKVTVTSDERVYNSANPYARIRVIITTSWEWFGQAGGVAFINSFFWGDDTPCFIFSSLLNYNTKYIADATPHEAGHTVGLYHQSICTNGVNTTEYNPGANGEAPIMGVAYYQPVRKWWVGTNSYCTIQDDSAILSKNLGLK